MQAILTKADMSTLMNIANVDKNTKAVVTYTSNVKTASPKNNAKVAANPTVSIQKYVVANVTLFNNADNDTYIKQVKQSAKEVGISTTQEIKQFEVTEPAYFHTDIYSVVQNKVTGKQYLYAHYEGAQTEYFIDGVLATKAEVAEYLTPSEAKKLLDDSGIVYNATNDIYHAVIVRTIALENVKSIVLMA
jgi:hypothetical protein